MAPNHSIGLRFLLLLTMTNYCKNSQVWVKKQFHLKCDLKHLACLRSTCCFWSIGVYLCTYFLGFSLIVLFLKNGKIQLTLCSAAFILYIQRALAGCSPPPPTCSIFRLAHFPASWLMSLEEFSKGQEPLSPPVIDSQSSHPHWSAVNLQAHGRCSFHLLWIWLLQDLGSSQGPSRALLSTQQAFALL